MFHKTAVRIGRPSGTVGADGDGDGGPVEAGMARIRYFVGVVALLAAGLHPSPATAAQTVEAPSRAWNVAQLHKLLAAEPSSDVVSIADMIFKRATIVAHRDRLAAGSATDTADSASASGVNFWPGGNVYYSFDPNVSAPHQ